VKHQTFLSSKSRKTIKDKVKKIIQKKINELVKVDALKKS
jgi:hypothetical protein